MRRMIAARSAQFRETSRIPFAGKCSTMTLYLDRQDRLSRFFPSPPPPASRTLVTAKPLSSAALVLYSCALALGLGVGSAYWVLSGDYPFGGVRIGAWNTWPKVGSRNADPYARAIVTRRGDVPLATGEGLSLSATGDSGGQAFDSACAYRIGAITAQARLWTLSLYDGGGTPAATDLGRSSMTSAEVLREPDGKFSIVLSREARPGNWMQLPKAGPFSLVLRLYDTPAATGSAALDPAAFPPVERLECGA
jgi:hypothetical protein